MKEVVNQRLSELLELVDGIREEHPGCGVEKMYYTIQPDWMGRDRFIEIMMGLGYRLQQARAFTRTTIPASYHYPNLIEGMLLWDRNQVWQSDITYFRVQEEFFYLVFITDVYTKRILGYQASDHLWAAANLKALKMALRSCGVIEHQLIHHSDRGSQYIDKEYTDLLSSKGIHISMCQKPQENAYAERVNGIIKNEYLRYRSINSLSELRVKLKQAVNHYNRKRIHNSLPSHLSPEQFDKKLVNLDSQKRPTVIVYAEGNPEIKCVSNPLDFLPEKTALVPVCPMVS